MSQSVIKGAYATLSSALLAITGLNFGIDAAVAQSRQQVCQPPEAGEYLLLIVTKTARSQRLLRQTLPDNNNTTVCKYLDTVVTRIGGFTRLEDAQDWVRYINDIARLPAFVVEPSAGAQFISATRQLSSSSPRREDEQKPRVSSANVPAFNPKLLGTGYAVLVDYLNKPEIASELQQLLGKKVGLVSFGQRPYLLALHTSNERNASNTFRLLSDRGFWVMLVDAGKVTLLKSQVESLD